MGAAVPAAAALTGTDGAPLTGTDAAPLTGTDARARIVGAGAGLAGSTSTGASTAAAVGGGEAGGHTGALAAHRPVGTAGAVGGAWKLGAPGGISKIAVNRGAIGSGSAVTGVSSAVTDV